jgi:hypothetical protein
MQTNRTAVRFYIDRDADTPVVRSVPVSRPSIAAVTDPRGSATHHLGSCDEGATAFAASESRRRGARHRLISIVQLSLRKPRRHAS